MNIGVIAVVMAIAMIGMVICAKKQKTHPQVHGVALVLLVVVALCGVAILYEAGVFGENGRTEAIIRNEMKYVKAEGIIVTRDIVKACPGQKILLITPKNYDKDSRVKELISAVKEVVNDNSLVVLDYAAGLTKKDNPKPAKSASAPTVVMEDDPEAAMQQPVGPLDEQVNDADIEAVVAKHPDCNVIFPLIGLPDSFRGAFLKDGNRKMALTHGDNYKFVNALKAGKLLTLVIYSPDMIITEDPAPKDPQKAFDVRCILVTPQNINEMLDKYPDSFKQP